MTLLYRLITGAYYRGLALAASLGHERAAKWISGRHDQITPQKKSGTKRLWMHCASLGEWEQGRPVLEALSAELPEWETVLTFFSPSGYERCRDLKLVDHVLYLPKDAPDTAEKWVRELEPDLAVFVKYEFWYYHLRALTLARVPTWLVAASFRPSQLFFKPYGGWYREMLHAFSGIITQTMASRSLLVTYTNFPAKKITIAGDPRMDRTLALTDIPFEDPKIKEFCATGRTIIAGSVWPPDIAVWQAAWPSLEETDWKIIFAPHQLHEPALQELQSEWDAVRYTKVSVDELSGQRVLILDTIGMLSKVYRYGSVAYIGGGFKTGLHNTLEPMAYGLPTLFGPKHKKFPEAAAAIAAGGAFSILDDEDLIDRLHQLSEPDAYGDASTAQHTLGKASAGAGKRTADIILQSLRATQVNGT